MFKQYQKYIANITISIISEFKTFLSLGLFQKNYLSALGSLIFYPTFIFNGPYSNIAKQIRRYIHSDVKNVLMTTVIPARHHPRLIKLVELYFKMQSI